MLVCAVVLLVNHLDNKEPFRHLYIFKHVLKNNFVMFINAHLVEQELLTLTLPEHLSSPPRFSCYSIFSFICMFCKSLFVLCTFYLAIVLSVLLRYTDSDCPFGIFKLFLGQATTNYLIYNIDSLLFIIIDWCLTPTLTIFQLYRGHYRFIKYNQ
jgi:hypothetical protein